MKIIVITGPSGSGKTKLSNEIARHIGNTIIIQTDSYYRDDLFIKLLSIFQNDIYDRLISIKDYEVKKTITSILNRCEYTTFYKYDFTRRKSTKSKRKIQNKNSLRYIILEGIFSHRLNLNYKKTINIVCEEEKELCYKRRISRDQAERGRTKYEIIKRFNKSWDLFLNNINYFINNNKVILINPSKITCYKKLINN